MAGVKAGVLALQGDFREHARMLAACGATPVLVRHPEELDDVQALCIPGGESTSIAKLAVAYGLVEPIRARALAGMPVFGTCAGMILLANRLDQGSTPLLSLIDVEVRRNAYGRQVDSFEAEVQVTDVGPVRASFIRAPVVTSVGAGVDVLAEHEGVPVLVRQRNVLAASFHPELAGDPRLHELALSLGD
jgi:5'-phosphate synthase pdxT subunit